MANVQDDNFFALDAVEDQVWKRSRYESPNVGVIGLAALIGKISETSDKTLDPVVNARRSVRAALSNVVGDGLEIPDCASRIADYHGSKRR